MKFSDLTSDAQDRAVEIWREGFDFPDNDFLREDFERVANILGIEFDKGEPCWDIRYCQGSGASFTGSYRFRAEAHDEIVAYAPCDKELHEIAKRLQVVEFKRVVWGGVLDNNGAVVITRSHDGSYVHEYTMRMETECYWYESFEDDGHQEFYDACDAAEKEITDIFRTFAGWIHEVATRDYESQTSDSTIRETLSDDYHDFDEDGTLL